MTDSQWSQEPNCDVACPLSKRADMRHSWLFDGDDPYVVCAYCGERRDAISGKTIALGRLLVSGPMQSCPQCGRTAPIVFVNEAGEGSLCSCGTRMHIPERYQPVPMTMDTASG